MYSVFTAAAKTADIWIQPANMTIFELYVQMQFFFH